MRAFTIAALAALCAVIPTSEALAADIEAERDDKQPEMTTNEFFAMLDGQEIDADMDIEAEMEKWVYTPCLQVWSALNVANYREAEIASAANREDLTFARWANSYAIDAGKEALRPILKGKNWNWRKVVYKASLKECIGDVVIFEGLGRNRRGLPYE